MKVDPLRPAPARKPVSLEPFRDQARDALRLSNSIPSDSLVELTAIVLAEKELRGTDVAATAEQGWVAARAAAAGMLSPALAVVLSQVDSKKLMPFRNFQGENRIQTVARGLDDIRRANRAAGLVSADGLTSGLHNATEAAQLDAALDDLSARVGPERVKQLIKKLHVATVLGQVGADAGSMTNIAGLAENGVIGLERALLGQPEKLREKLYHEFGHLLDSHLGRSNYISHSSGSPFGRGHELTEVASSYGQRNAHEDFAETHALLLLNWERVQEQPELYLHARGKLGQKAAWILKHGYGVDLPEPKPAIARMLEKVQRGESPFGWRDANGGLHDAESSYLAALDGWLQSNPAQFSDPHHPQAAQRKWLVDALQGECGLAQPANSQTAWSALQQMRALEHHPSQDWKLIKARQEEQLQIVQSQLAAGGQSLVAEVKRQVELVPRHSEQDRLGYRLERIWSGVRLKGLAAAYRPPLEQ